MRRGWRPVTVGGVLMTMLAGVGAQTAVAEVATSARVEASEATTAAPAGDALPFGILGAVRATRRVLVFRVGTGDLPAGTVLVVTRDGRSVTRARVQAAGRPLRVQVPNRGGTYQVKVKSGTQWVFGEVPTSGSGSCPSCADPQVRVVPFRLFEAAPRQTVEQGSFAINAGRSTVWVHDPIIISGPEFAMEDSTCSGELRSSDTCALRVTFTPPPRTDWGTVFSGMLLVMVEGSASVFVPLSGAQAHI